MFRLRLVPLIALTWWATMAGTRAFIPAVSSDGAPWVMGYAVGYERDLLPLGELNWGALTHVAVGRAVPNPDGTLNTDFDIGAVSGPAWARSVVRGAHAHGVQAILMLGGAGEETGFAGAASDAHRAAFVNNILTVVENFGFDGVDLDWEPLTRAITDCP